MFEIAILILLLAYLVVSFHLVSFKFVTFLLSLLGNLLKLHENRFRERCQAICLV